MAYIVKCSLCGHDVSNECGSCPRCGNNVAAELARKERKKYIPKILVGIGIVLLILSAILFYDVISMNAEIDNKVIFILDKPLLNARMEQVNSYQRTGIFSAVGGVVCIVIALIKRKK